MGIFGKKQQDDFAYQDQPVDNHPTDAVAPAPPAPQGSIDGVLPANDQPAQDFMNHGVPPVQDQPVEDTSSSYIMADPQTPQNNWANDADGHQHDDAPQENHPIEVEASTEDQPPVEEQQPISPEPNVEAVDVPSTHPLPGSSVPSDLADIRDKALKELSPLVSHLEQSPEERFHTAMMMLQATDDHSLVKTAYEAAQEITDEKTKAQALLDIVNEINYFTQKS